MGKIRTFKFIAAAKSFQVFKILIATFVSFKTRHQRTCNPAPRYIYIYIYLFIQLFIYLFSYIRLVKTECHSAFEYNNVRIKAKKEKNYDAATVSKLMVNSPALSFFVFCIFPDLFIYTGWPKNQHFLCRITFSNIDQFLKTFFIVRIMRKFVIVLSLKIPPHLKCVATLPCETAVS